MAPIVQAAPLLLVVGAAAFAGACGGGSPASPSYTTVTSATNDNGFGSDASTSDAAGATDGASFAAVPFANCGASPASGSIPADVLAVMSARCQTCHQDPPLNGAPFPLLTYDDVHGLFAMTIPKYQEMHALIQPDGSPHMPFGMAPQLTAAQFKTLDDWLLDCAPPGE
jgi:hypothetical protein